ncbi:asparagine synthase (glutamine-hydrolyzing) [Halorubrum alkaliphilum]|uniref:Asparagine synthase (Glutamine-hydrolyzing) n=1 Tax=Halorubrum alkaliphilum TaxID=261290 RepID=A0A8T4GG61_9EURY|nr:asparagine synthase-related protein [Halorubrum alkaliphilum]MBP1922707.1 asparagine synthase (glutamine-hydrolyzing) [Halorubrum alkaliphilum]
MSDETVDAEPNDRLRGASAALVADAIRTGDPFPGTCGFAGLLADPPDEIAPVLVRDVLGRQPLFVERDADDPIRSSAWGFDLTGLDDPVAVPAGSVVSDAETGTGVDPGAGPEIRRIWSLQTSGPDDPAVAQTAVDDAIDGALVDLGSGPGTDTGTDSDGRLAVAFSGGVDSGLVASAVPDAPCYVAGFEACHDVAAARAAAETMSLDVRVVEITHEDLRRVIPEIAAATGRRNPMDLNIAVPLYLTAEAAADDGVDRLAVGQGADELFGGYSKVVEPAEDHRVDADTVRGARTETVHTLPAQLERDVLALRAAGVEPLAPLLDDRVVDAALRLPGELLATPDQRKVALRRTAAQRLPEPVWSADKKAVQYGTYVAREIDRLARQNGFKRRMDDHVGQYIESLLAT